MESSSNRPSPFVPAAQVPLHRNPPLAPSQELAYREKCIALKRRLMEIEANNDNLRKRLEREKRFQDKMRLNRAILLNHLKEMMEDDPNKKPTQQDLENLTSGTRGSGNLAEHLGYDLSQTPGMRGAARGEYIMDDSSAESEEEVEPEPQEQPLSRKRTRNSANVRDTPTGNLNSVAATPIHQTHTYHQTSLPSLAPAQSYSPTAHQEPPMIPSFRVSSSSLPTASPLPVAYTSQQAPAFSHLQSPTIAQHYGVTSPGMLPTESASVAPPVRPQAPYEQFTAHMTPQLVKDNYKADEMSEKIIELWRNMTAGDRGLWEQRYQEQMMEYEKAMDEWKREQRKGAGGGFSAVNR